MIQLQIRAKGAARAIVDRKAAGIYADVWQIAIHQAMAEWVRGPMRERFSPSAFGVYGFSRRSPSYVRQQIRRLGAATPYVSPQGRAMNFARVAGQLVQGNLLGSIAALQQQSKATMRMRDLIRIPGAGFNIASSGRVRIATTLKLPGARKLNAIPDPAGSLYRRQLADLSRGGARDWRWISRRAETIFHHRLMPALARAA